MVLPGGQILHAESPEIVADTLEEGREAIPLGLCRMPRHPEDDVAIVEVWI